MGYILFETKKANSQLNSLFIDIISSITTTYNISNRDELLIATGNFDQANITEIINNLSNEFLADIKVFVSDKHSPDEKIIIPLFKLIPFYQTTVYNNNLLYFNLINVVDKKILRKLILKHYDNHETVEMIRLFLQSNQNTTQTAKKIFYHRNTLILKLDKFKNETGFDLKQFTDAYIIYYLIN